MSVCIWHLGGGWTTHLKNISQIGSSHQVVVKMTNIWNHQLGHYWWIALKHEVVTDVTKLASEKIREVSHHFRHLSQQCDFHRHFFWCFFSLPETDGLHGQGEFSFSGQHTHRHFPDQYVPPRRLCSHDSPPKGKEGESRWPTLVGVEKTYPQNFSRWRKTFLVFFFRPYISQWGKRNLFNLEAK